MIQVNMWELGSTRALDRCINFEENRIYGWKNGAGKTTLLNIITNRVTRWRRSSCGRNACNGK